MGRAGAGDFRAKRAVHRFVVSRRRRDHGASGRGWRWRARPHSGLGSGGGRGSARGLCARASRTRSGDRGLRREGRAMTLPAKRGRKLVGTGWKMNHGIADTLAYIDLLRERLAGINHHGLDVFVLPPFTALSAAGARVAGSEIGVGAQNVHWDDRGAWTGEVSAPM